MKKILLLSSLLIVLGSCKKDEPAPPANNNPGNTNTTPEFALTASSGSTWTTKDVRARVIAGDYILVAESNQGAAIRINLGFNSGTITKDTIKLNPGGSTGRAIYYETSSKEEDGYATNETFAGVTNPGWIKFSSYDPAKRTATGTFSFTLSESSGSGTTTVSGSFKNISEDTAKIVFPNDTFGVKLDGSPVEIVFYTGGANENETSISFLGADDDDHDYGFFVPQLIAPGTYTSGEHVRMQFEGFGVQTGTVTITKNDILLRIIQGTFSGESQLGDEITEGSFSLVY